MDEDEVSETPISTAQFDSLNKKLDTLLASSSSQNSSKWESVLAANTTALKDSAKAVAYSAKALTATTATVEKLQLEITTFMDGFSTSFDSNTAKVNKVIAHFQESLTEEKKALADLRTELKLEHSEMVTDVVSKLENMKEDIAMEANVMDVLAEKISKLSNKNLRLRIL